MKAALAELPDVEEVTHEVGTDTFIVRHSGELNHAARAVDRKVIFRRARKWLERLARRQLR